MKTEIFTPFACGAMTKLFSKDEANACFAEKKVAFFAGGTGHPYFSTDTTTVLRAIEIEAETILLAKAVMVFMTVIRRRIRTLKSTTACIFRKSLTRNWQW